jgi:hypothetical protein
MLILDLSLEKLPTAAAGTQLDSSNSLSFNILRANHLLAIFYPDPLHRPAANSSTFKDLEIRSAIFFNPDYP